MKGSSTISELKRLDRTPEEQAAYATKLVKTERNIQVIRAALEVLAENPYPAARSVLCELYQKLDAQGIKRDAGGYTRGATLKALKGVVEVNDIPLLERAASTYEFMPPKHTEEAQVIRAGAIIALNEVDEDLASYHCVRLLVDPYTSVMSGEPALTAVRVLVAQGNTLPLYNYVIQDRNKISEVLAECLKNLVDIPVSILASIVGQYGDEEDEVALMGLFDLILEHEDGANFIDFVTEFLIATREYNLYHYVVISMIAGRKTEWSSALQKLSSGERDSRKIQSLIEACSLAPGHLFADALIEDLQSRVK